MVLSSCWTSVSSRLSTVSAMSTAAASSPRPPGASIPDAAASRLLAGLLAGALLTAVALPARNLVRGAEARDSFPFSHYPMFSAKRKAHYWVTHLLGIEADGTARPLHYSYLGTGGLNAVRRQVRRRVNAGDGPRLAALAAERIARRDRPADRDVVRVHMVRGRYLVDPFMRGRSREDFTTRLRLSGSAEVPGRAPLAPGMDPLTAAAAAPAAAGVAVEEEAR